MEIFLNGFVCPNDWRDIQTSNHLFSNAFERQRRSKTNDLMFAKVEIQNFQNVNKRKFRLLIWNIVTLYFIVVSFLEIRDLCVVVMAWFSILYIEYRGTEVHGSGYFFEFLHVILFDCGLLNSKIVKNYHKILENHRKIIV